MQKIRIEEMDFADIPQVMQLEKESGLECWSVSSYEESLKSENYIILVAKSENKIVGFLSMYIVADEGYVCNIAVDSKYRHLGIGTSLAHKIIGYSEDKNLKFLSLEVRKSNNVAIRFYDKLGFIKLGERKDFYSYPTEDALIMTKYF